MNSVYVLLDILTDGKSIQGSGKWAKRSKVTLGLQFRNKRKEKTLQG